MDKVVPGWNSAKYSFFMVCQSCQQNELIHLLLFIIIIVILLYELQCTYIVVTADLT